jgi:O-antigen ligase
MIYTFGLLALCLAWLLPGHYFPWTSFQQNGLAAIGAWLVALAAVVSVKAWAARVPALALGALALAVVPLLQWATGQLDFLSDAFFPAVYLAGFAVCIVAGMQLARSSPPFAPSLLAVIAVAAFVSVGLCIVQWLELGPYTFVEAIDRGGRPAGNIYQPNLMSTLFGLGIAAVLAAYELRKIAGTAAAAGVAVLAFGMLMTQSRAPWLFVLVFVAMWVLFRRRLPLRTPGVAVATSVVLFIVGVLFWGPLSMWLKPDAGAELMGARWTSGYRWTHWKTVLDGLLDSPWIGYGWLQIAAAQQAAVLDHPATFELLSASHNQLLDLLVWNGIPLGMLVIGGLAAWAVSRMRHCPDAMAWALLLALGILFAHATVEFPLEYLYYLLPAGLMIGVIESRMPVSPGPSLRVGRIPFALITLALGCTIWFVANEYFKVEESVRRVRLLNAGYVQPGAPPTVPDVQVMDFLREYVRMQLTAQPREGMSPEEIDLLRSVSRRYGSPGALMRYATAAGLNGRDAEAQRALEIMCHVAKERHCNDARKRWNLLAASHPRLSAIRFPPTPERRFAMPTERVQQAAPL